MGKMLIIKGANFSANSFDNDSGTPTYRSGTVIDKLWPSSGTQFNSANGYKSVAFQVTPGEQYIVENDHELSAPFGFSAALPEGGTQYIGGARVLVAAGTPATGTVPAGAAYMTFGQIASDGGGINLFPSAISIGADIVDVSQYR